MAQGHPSETLDKAAALLLGTPALSGAMLLILALGSPGSVPYRERSTTIPIAVALIVLGGSGELRMSSDLNHLISFHTRRKLWRSLRQLRIGLPALAVPKWAMSIIFILSLAITFGTTIPLVQYLDEKAPIHTQSTTERTFAEVIVRGGFFGLLLASSIVLTLVFWALFPVFPGSCRTIGHIAAYLPGERPADMPITPWTKELVSSEVHHIIADCLDVPEEQIRPSTPCNESGEKASSTLPTGIQSVNTLYVHPLI